MSLAQPPAFGEGIDMAKKPSNHQKPWSAADDRALRALAKGNTPTRVVGLKLGRTEGAVASHASEIGVSLKPTNQSPYGSKGK
jgi:hypothetical protein